MIHWLRNMFFKPCQCIYCKYERGEEISERGYKEVYRRDAKKFIKESLKEAKLLIKLFK